MKDLGIKIKILSHIIMLVSIIGVSCNNFLDVGDSPNNPEDVPIQTILPAALAGTAFASSNELNRFSSTIMSVIAGVANLSARWDIYNVDGGDFGLQWNRELYGGALLNYQKLIDQSEREQHAAYAGVGKIMKAFTFAMVTDAWGDVPYAEALKGDYELTTPKLNSQRDIYLGNAEGGIQGLFDLVREGLADLEKPSAATIGVEDLIYQGNLDKWRRAGHALLLKLAMQISSVEPEFARQIIQEEINKGLYITENDQNLSFNFGAQPGSQSPLWTQSRNSVFRNDFMISGRFVELLQGNNDPRLPIFVTRPAGDYVTIDNGFRGTPPPVNNRSIYNAYAVGTNGEGPTRLITNAQIAFILAEAIVRMGISAHSAQEQYQRGIRASMQEAGLTDAAIDQYLAENPQVSTLAGSVDTQVEQIITQKYIALYSNGLEQWNDWRRTGYPVLADHQNAAGVDGTRPRRLVYLFTEQQRNPHFPQGDSVPQSNVPVWWDVN